MRIERFLAAVGLFLAGSLAQAAPTWMKQLDEAQQAARKDWKPIMIDAGRKL